jgi:hypothetical protein
MKKNINTLDVKIQIISLLAAQFVRAILLVHHYFISDHDPYDVLCVVLFVLEDMEEVKMLVVELC